MKSYRRTIRTLLFVFTCIFIAGIPGYGQDTSSLSGTITDSSGALVPKANITLRNNATRIEIRATSNDSGNFTVTNLAPGNYNLHVEAPGFQTTDLNGIQVDPNIGRRVDVTMRVGDTATSITVEANANTVQTESGAVGQLITQEQVKNIQLNGRNPIYLAQMEPGVVRGQSMAAFSFGLDNGINVNGARSQESVITFDGAPMVRTRSNGTSVGVADVDSTSQIQVLTTSYAAEYGRTSGGQIRMVPKSGSSEFHGSAFEYFRNSALNANTWKNNQAGAARGAFRYNQFGWNLNGPVFFGGFNKNHDKLFFLVGQEWVKFPHNDVVFNKTPTALMRQGNFSELLGSNIFYSSPVQIVDPTTGTPYAGNIIPQGQLSQNGTGLLRAYPLPNVSAPTYNWVDSALYTENQRKDSVVVDLVPTDKHHFRFSMLNYNYNDYEPHFGNFNTNPRIFNRPNQIGVVHWTWTISPTWVNDAYASGAADHVTIGIDTKSGLFDRTKYGINYPYLFGAADKVVPNKIPTIQIAGFTTLDGGPYPSRSGGIVYDFGDNVTKVWGNHTIKFGFQWEYAGENNYDQISVDNTRPGTTNNQNGLFNFGDGQAITSKAAVANAALGDFNTYGEIGTRSYTLFRGNMYSMYGQDQWRVNPKLVLEYGLRYDIMQSYHALWGNQAFFNPANYNPALAPTVNPQTGFLTGGDPYNGVVIPGSGFPSKAKGHVPDSILNGNYQRLFRGYDSNYSPTVYTNIQPRVGFAYQIDPNTVIRAGVGRYVQRLGISDTVHVGGNAPFQPASSVTNGSVDAPGGNGVNQLPLAFTSHAYKYPSPEAWGWNLTVEHDFSKLAVFTLSYVGRRGYHLEQLANINQLPIGTVAPGTQNLINKINPDSLRPYKGFSTIIEAENTGGSFYHSMQANLKRRVTKGLLFGAAYTWSKSLDYGSSNGTNIVNAYDNSIMFGPSDFDTRHVLVLNYVYDIGFANGMSNVFGRTLLGNWQFSGTIQGQSGRPQSVSRNLDQAGVGPGSGNQFYLRTAEAKLPHQFGKTGTWFDPSVFKAAAPGTFAPRGSRGYIYGPGFNSFSAALQKEFHIIPSHENHALVFKAEAFNYLNHPNLDNPDMSPTSSTFGQVTTKGGTYSSERQFQFSLRYAF
ncbi:TonB-dependent receptor [Edaphobacter albus]|uniref:TonB-dependent receptor n=1 Tax=Edaphobacter sp. 4G125 TaxID=2763071 RepID=UPI0021085311|nr:TonB-dependent receptor [Edaphobacter sp. 4G125]